MEDEIIKNLLKSKNKRRKELARLPIEEKIDILIKMQTLAKNINKNIKHKVWEK